MDLGTELTNLYEEGFGTPTVDENEEPFCDGIRRIILPGGLVVSEGEIERHFEEGYQPEEQQTEEVWKKARRYLEVLGQV